MAISQDPLNLIICGVGGQGNILISQLIGRALMKKGFLVTRGETFGASQRGGAVMSNIRISAKETYGPLIPEGKAHVILSLEPLETVRILQKYGNPEVVCVTNTHPIVPIGVILSEQNKYPAPNGLRETISSLTQTAWFLDAADIASRLGAPIVTNMVMLGAFIGTKVLPLSTEDAEMEIKDNFPSETLELNMKAFREGLETTQQNNETKGDKK